MADQTSFILTKIIATLGPASGDVKSICQLIDAGARLFRINFSHGSFDAFEKLLHAVRQAAKQTGIPVAALGDLSGPKLRIGKVQGQGIELKVSDSVILVQEPIEAVPAQPGQPIYFSTTAPDVLPDIQADQRVLINDGDVQLQATEQKQTPQGCQICCKVIVPGLVTSAKGLNLPDTKLNLPCMTEHDWQCMKWAVEHGIDFLALSFVRQAADVRLLRQALQAYVDRGEPGEPGEPGDRGHVGSTQEPIPVIAKIEKPQAIDDLENIIDEADGIMVARGDLGVEMDLAQVPVIQKRIIRLAHDYGKPVIVATQMLQSMIDSPNPTRAEVSDVANAIYDGADAVMLSGETAVGKYPVQAVTMMARVARITIDQLILDHVPIQRKRTKHLDENKYRTAAMARGVAAVVDDLDVKLVVTWSQLGGGARFLSRHRLTVPIISASDQIQIVRRKMLWYGVVPLLMDKPAGREAFASDVDKIIQKYHWAKAGEPIVLVAGKPIGIPGVTNTLWLRYLGDMCPIN